MRVSALTDIDVKAASLRKSQRVKRTNYGD